MGVEAFVMRFDCPKGCESTAIRSLAQSFDVIHDVEEQSLNSSQQLVIRVENRGAIQLRVASDTVGESQPIYMRFAYCCPNTVERVFLDVSCVLVRAGCKCTVLSAIHEIIGSCEEINSTLPKMIAEFRQNWFDTVNSHERVLLKPDEVWDYFFDFISGD